MLWIFDYPDTNNLSIKMYQRHNSKYGIYTVSLFGYICHEHECRDIFSLFNIPNIQRSSFQKKHTYIHIVASPCKMFNRVTSLDWIFLNVTSVFLKDALFLIPWDVHISQDDQVYIWQCRTCHLSISTLIGATDGLSHCSFFFFLALGSEKKKYSAYE